MTILSIAALCVATDDVAIHTAVVARNAAYKKFLEERCDFVRVHISS
jgi:hypothetical protein